MRILGIDVGSSSVKAVEMDSAFGRFDIYDHHEKPLTSDHTPEETVTELVKSLPRQPDRIVYALNTAATTFRNLTLPTRDKKAIQSGVGFEIEDELPFATEEMLFDYSIHAQSKQGSTVHVAATLKQQIHSSLEMWRKTSIEPDIITTEAWAYRTLLNRIIAPNAQELPALMIQMGKERTTLYLHWRGAPAFIKDIPWGGQDLTAAISKTFDIPIEQAESIKLDQGFVSGSGSTEELTLEQVELTTCLEESLNVLLVELRQAGLVAKNITLHAISTFYLSGGASLLSGLGPWIEDKLNIPTRPLMALSSATASGVTYSDQNDARFPLAVSLCLSIVGSDRGSCINFRKGAYSKAGPTREFNFHLFKKPLIATMIVALCLFSSLIVQSRVYKSRLSSIDTQLERSVKGFFGQISSSALRTYMANPNTLRSSIHKEMTRQKEMTRLFGPNLRSPLDFLNSLSSNIPKDTVVDLVQFQAGFPNSDSFLTTENLASTSLSFLVAQPQMIEKLASQLSGRFSQLQKEKTEEITLPEDNTKKWKVTFSGKLTEDSYVK